MDRVFRCYVEKKPGFDGEARTLFQDFKGFLGLTTLTSLRLFHRYDVEGIGPDIWRAARTTVLSEPVCDDLYEENPPPLSPDTRLLTVEALPGQYDQRADSCAQCIQMITGRERPLVRTARVYAAQGLDQAAFDRMTAYVINPVEAGPAPAEKPSTLRRQFDAPQPVPVLSGFTGLDSAGLAALRETHGLAMDMADLTFFQSYFHTEGRDPTLTELKVVDTYWSDHCRHTTFHTRLTETDIRDTRVRRAYNAYLDARRDLYGAAAEQRPVTLMDIATCGMKWLKQQGKLPHLDESDEINACTVRVRAEVDGQPEDWLLLFKNETHNHPTEIEPFGGAATCIGGAIRDPLSGRAYVYQAMRVTGAGDPRAPLSDTLPGKLPQRKLTTTAAAGYSSYGNQIGLATGFVREYYHPGYVAKRMELGAVVGAAPAGWVTRETPQPGDLVLLLGGRTGRDGIGGATGSSKSHDARSVTACAAEVQKGNPPEERKLQRLFRDPAVTRLIRRCNDFGAGGVAVAIGELADGLRIDLDKVPKKYEGLDGTELAISESQERMAVVVSPGDAEAMIRAAAAENLEATVVAEVTAAARLVMCWNGQTVADISRDFLNTNGAPKTATARVNPPGGRVPTGGDNELASRLLALASDLNFCSQKGLVERFDSSIGAGSVLVPHGGVHRATPTQVMAALLPALHGQSATCSVMSTAFDPVMAENDPFGAARWAVIESAARLVAAGCSRDETYLTLQEYFPRLREEPARWGLPLAALLGAFEAQRELGIAAIGGKDSMSGSFMDLDVPPAVVSFAVTTAPADRVLSPEWKGPGHGVYLLASPSTKEGRPDYPALLARWDDFHALCRRGRVLSAMTCGEGGPAGAVMLMCLGNGIGFATAPRPDSFRWFDRTAGGLVFECDGDAALPDAVLLGHTEDSGRLAFGGTILPLSALRVAWEKPLASVFPTTADGDQTADGSGAAGLTEDGAMPALAHPARAARPLSPRTAKPRAVIPVFPGTNCEYDSARGVERAGGAAQVLVIRNLTPAALTESAQAMAAALDQSHMLFIPGGFSAGDEPDGSGKFMAAFFRHPRLTEAVRALLFRGGLILGVCNGFQALIKLGLVPYGDILDSEKLEATLTFNSVGYRSRYVTTRVSSALSPWLSRCELGQVHTVPVAHGEGRFTASPERLAALVRKGQVAFQYCDAQGQPSMATEVNPNGSLYAIEGITSPDGRVLGKMAHTERYNPLSAKNIPGEKYQPLFEGGVDYFR
ncbi:MAG: phosphoribosylformylglycinamidine synthase [Oscillospiraceae bacterium]|jgi:phosphoribosylformylglycinamidine synthase|nr:phosphoribosylformylglycinamidine synthase [Oscillospiraceae bacterium]